MSLAIPLPEMFFTNGCLDDQEVIRPGVHSSGSSPLAGLPLWEEGSVTADVVEGLCGNKTCELLESSRRSNHLQSWMISFVKTFIVSGICVFGIFGNLLTLVALSRKRLQVIITIIIIIIIIIIVVVVVVVIVIVIVIVIIIVIIIIIIIIIIIYDLFSVYDLYWD